MNILLYLYILSIFSRILQEVSNMSNLNRWVAHRNILIFQGCFKHHSYLQKLRKQLNQQNLGHPQLSLCEIAYKHHSRSSLILNSYYKEVTLWTARWTSLHVSVPKPRGSIKPLSEMLKYVSSVGSSAIHFLLRALERANLACMLSARRYGTTEGGKIRIDPSIDPYVNWYVAPWGEDLGIDWFRKLGLRSFTLSELAGAVAVAIAW